MVSCSLASSLVARTTPQEYVAKWKDAAIEQMRSHRIPASITLAQAILESGSGNSLLAKEANNHFGIKCHNTWDGPTFHKDDDRKNECFRVYDRVEASYEDHSQILKKSRYDELYTYDITDYKSWAKGLMKAGYATSRTYAVKLIDIIERYELNQYDKVQEKELYVTRKVEQDPLSPVVTVGQKGTKRQAMMHRNKIKYIVAERGDTYYRISKEFGIALWQLYKYNDFGDRKDYLRPGDIIYLEPKKRNAKDTGHIDTEERMSLREIAQKEGVRLKRLMRMNRVNSPNHMFEKGQRVSLK
ncbi:MAG: LysM peptidoglycan-binding domain-containing protein [Bacteroidetes bacterium]|nr:MAG: LysM peptidoglycan-binding domain-containing protein [Bacteroidota bacterium]